MTITDKKLIALQHKIIRELTDTVIFYADIETYFAIAFLSDPPCGEFITDFEKSDLGLKPGKRARRALKKYLKYINDSGLQ